MPLRAVIFGLDGVFIDATSKKTVADSSQKDLSRLFVFLHDSGVEPLILSNRTWTAADSGEPIGDYLTKQYGENRLYETFKMGLPPKGTKKIVSEILRLENLQRHEVMYVGTSKWDFRTAVNSKLLFGNATWARCDVPYGFAFDTPAAVRAFIELFGVKEHPWFFVIDGPVTLRSMAPFSTRNTDYERYSRAAREAAKRGTIERHFFLQSLVASVYLSGLTFQYIACVPGHKAGFGNPAMDDVLYTVGQIFNAKYVPDLILRHADAPKSQAIRLKGGSPSPLNQLNSIRLSKRPLKNVDERYKNPIDIIGKRVLVIDDFCTEGFSLEAARLYLEEAGAEVLLVSWLKTINRPYHLLELARGFDPYQAQVFEANEVQERHLGYAAHTVDRVAPRELTTAFGRYRQFRRTQTANTQL